MEHVFDFVHIFGGMQTWVAEEELYTVHDKGTHETHQQKNSRCFIHIDPVAVVRNEL